MEAVTLTANRFLPSPTLITGLAPVRSTKRGSRATVAAIRRSNSYGSGKAVDDAMTVLKKRIHDMKAVETNYEPPSDWMDWERQIHGSYEHLICLAIAAVQSRLMESRPSIAVASVAVLGVSVPTSVFLLTMHLASAVAAATGH